MMRGLCLLLCVAAVAPARASEWQGPACGRPAVLDTLAETLGRAGKTMALERDSAGQIAGAGVDMVRCAVRTHTAVYDTNRFGYAQQDRVEIVTYTLEFRQRGIFLRLG